MYQLRWLSKKVDTAPLLPYYQLQNYLGNIGTEKTKVEFCIGDSGLVGLVFSLFLNTNKITKATITTAATTPTIMGKALDDEDEGDDVGELPKA